MRGTKRTEQDRNLNEIMRFRLSPLSRKFYPMYRMRGQRAVFIQFESQHEKLPPAIRGPAAHCDTIRADSIQMTI